VSSMPAQTAALPRSVENANESEEIAIWNDLQNMRSQVHTLRNLFRICGADRTARPSSQTRVELAYQAYCFVSVTALSDHINHKIFRNLVPKIRVAPRVALKDYRFNQS
jgi:hypothetical protein